MNTGATKSDGRRNAKTNALRRLAPEYSAEMIEAIRPLARMVFENFFSCQWRGRKRIPKEPVLVVGNHNAGGIPDIFLLLHAWSEHFGNTRPLLGLAHQINFSTSLTRSLVSGIGGIYASRENARAHAPAPCRDQGSTRFREHRQ